MSNRRRLTMKRLPIALALAGLTLALVPPALAKGPSEASIDGPGLSSPIQIVVSGEDGMAPGSPMMLFAESVGFLPAAFGRAGYGDTDPTTKDVSPMLSGRPAGNLGPRYVVTYVVPGPDGAEDVLVQHLYPYAKPTPVSYMPPGQPFFDWRKTAGGWFRSDAGLKDRLVAAGLPETPRAEVPNDPFPWTPLAASLALALALAAVITAFVVRRRPQPAT
jgi:hypothetical protein